MNKVRLLLLSVFLAANFVILSTDNSPIIDRPLHSSAIILTVTGFTLLWIHRCLPSLSQTIASDDNYLSLPHAERPLSRVGLSSSDGGKILSSIRPILLPTLVIAAACARLELLRRTLGKIQCSQVGIEQILPLLVAISESWYSRSTVRKHGDAVVEHKPHMTIIRSLRRPRIRYILPALLFSWGSVLNALSTSGSRSTYICAVVLPYKILIPALQVVGVLLEVFILSAIRLILRHPRSQSPRKDREWPMVIIWICLGTAAFLSIVGAVVYLAKPEYRSWIISWDMPYFRSLISRTPLIVTALLCGLFILIWYGSLVACILVASMCTYLQSLEALWSFSSAYSQTTRGTTIFSLFLLFFSVIIFWHLQVTSEALSVQTGTRKAPGARLLLFGLMVSLSLVYISSNLLLSSHEVSFHPIRVLMDGAKDLHTERWKNGSQSKSLLEAVEEYQRRYRRLPPPGFDDWYKFATDHSSRVMDDFDSINKDLLPFWSLSPSEIRFRTWQMSANPWNEIAAISVRAGKAEISPNILPTHRWMLEGAVGMINTFAKYLPDMDLALNLNDECRVAVPWERMEALQGVEKNASISEALRQNSWSLNRANIWPALPEEPIAETVFEDHSFQSTFNRYGAVGCSPSSRARQERAWNKRDLCMSCAAPHSLGQFMQNWTLAAEICHQPDMAFLHGLYVSPAAFKTTHELMPVFSQSKVDGFNDILFPSPWNYMDKVKYDPSPDHPDLPFRKKSNTLFWRGATSEGVSSEGTWKGMTRQRLVHLANNLTSSQGVRVLLQTPSHKYRYQEIPSTNLRSLLKMDVGIVDKIARCGLRDCDDQRQEFGLVQQSDFQDHWKYRYLFDMDGAGFSGRFLPFLQSKSLPFKTALFREWYDSRLTPWLHFVPLDLRLHGVHSTLAYFAGVDGTVGGKRVFISPHEEEGEFIAEQGREWAGKVLRKEDMEIYLFRLLLEWGRLTDDGREDIAFRL